MTGSSPSDLAVAFRSFPRRADALRTRADETGRRAAVDEELAGLAAIVARAAGRLGVAADAESVAAKIAAVAPAEWRDETLDPLRQDALEAGALLRKAESTAGNGTGD